MPLLKATYEKNRKERVNAVLFAAAVIVLCALAVAASWGLL